MAKMEYNLKNIVEQFDKKISDEMYNEIDILLSTLINKFVEKHWLDKNSNNNRQELITLLQFLTGHMGQALSAGENYLIYPQLFYVENMEETDPAMQAIVDNKKNLYIDQIWKQVKLSLKRNRGRGNNG